MPRKERKDFIFIFKLASMRYRVKLVVLLSLICLLCGYVPYSLAILFKNPTLADFCDIFIMLPSFFFITYMLHEDFMKEVRRKWMHYAFLASLLLFVEGHGIHWAANQIHNEMLSGERGFEIAYFLDEILGHIVVFSGLYLSLFFLLIMRIGKRDNINRKEKSLLILSDGISGSYLAVGMIEGQVIIYFLIVGAIVLIFLAFMIFKRRMLINDSWTFFYLFYHIFFFFFAFLYYFLFGGFTEPSKLFGF